MQTMWRLVMMGMLAVSVQAAEVIWWEAEHPRATNFPERTWFNAQPNEKDKLSAGAWITNEGKRAAGEDEAFLRYPVEVDQGGTYHFWVRKFWKHGPFRWRFGAQPWQTCGREVALADNVSLRTHVGANWVSLGKVELARGTHVLEVRLLAKEGESKTAAFDCFVLSPRPFVPRGKLKPGERRGRAEPGFFAWEPPLDPFTDQALLDLRHLNEPVAGQNGFVQRRGKDLVLADGQPVRFWAVNVSAGNAARDRASIDYMARKLAKLGVNMVRFHSALFDRSADDPARIDRQKLDNLHYLVAAMKKQGIYTHISFYFPLWFEVKPHHGIPGYERINNKKPFALLFFQPRMQAIHRSWLQALLATPNPYTGTPLAKEPAAAMVEIVNEDNLFFWTFSRKSVPPVHWQTLEKRFGDDLIRRYGAIDKAFAAWGDKPGRQDDPPAGRVGIFEAWHMTRQSLEHADPAKRKRLADQVRFLTETQEDYFRRTTGYMKGELGYGGLVSCGNWKTADAATLGPLERHTYTAGDVIDRHAYFGGKHEGEGAGYSVRVGHRYEDATILTRPQRLPVQAVQVDGYPQIISELGWPQPNRYRAESMPISALYGSLQGIDGLFFFALGSNYVVDQGMGKFQYASPAIAASSPACALMYRRGAVPEARPVVHEALQLDELYALHGGAVFEADALDALRQADVQGDGRSSRPGKIDPRAFCVGPVVQQVDRRPGRSEMVDLSRLIDRRNRTIDNAAGHVRWDWGQGIVHLVAGENAAGAVGFLSKQRPIQSGPMKIDCGNAFASVFVVALDDRPVAQSKRLLVQAMTEDKPYGFRAEGGAIQDLGGAPFGVREIDCTIELTNEAGPIRRATPLDQNGYPREQALSVQQDSPTGRSVIELAPDAVWAILER